MNRKMRQTFTLFLAIFTAFAAGVVFAETALKADAKNKPVRLHIEQTRGSEDGYIEPSVTEFRSVFLSGFTPRELPIDEDLQEFIYMMCKDYSIDYALVLGLIETESSFRADIISQTNDYGLMQINQINHENLSNILGIEDFNDPYDNVRAGMFMLHNLFEKHKDTNKVLMAYNMGENGAQKLWLSGIFDTNYTRKVLLNAEKYRDKK